MSSDSRLSKMDILLAAGAIAAGMGIASLLNHCYKGCSSNLDIYRYDDMKQEQKYAPEGSGAIFDNEQPGYGCSWSSPDLRERCARRYRR